MRAADDGNLTAATRTAEAVAQHVPVLAKIVLGLMTIWATLYAFAAVSMDFGVSPEGGFGPAMQVISILDVSVIFAVYTWLAFQSPRMRAVEKTGWVFAMLFLFPFVVPLFWYLHVWRAPGLPCADAGRP